MFRTTLFARIIVTSAALVMFIAISSRTEAGDIINDLTTDFPLGDGGPAESAAQFDEGLNVTLPGNAELGGEDGLQVTGKHPGASTFSETEPSLVVSPRAGGEGIAD